MSRFVILVLDGAGVGALPDAAHYGDEGSNTLGNLSRHVRLRLPHLEELGLGNILPLRGVPPAAEPLAFPGRLVERSAGKDSTAGHWEHMGLVTDRPFPVYPDGFPDEVLDLFRSAIGREVLGNRPASGTGIIDELGVEHLATGRPIIYTSADSVFQIAAHIEAVPLEELYRWCLIARGILTGPHAVNRVIARPFSGVAGAFVRTPDRRDFSLDPLGPTYLDLLRTRGVPVCALGKVSQLFNGRGVSEEIGAHTNEENLGRLAALLDRGSQGLLFSNLVDFDMVWGHRNDIDGFAAGLAAFDAALPGILDRLGPADRLVITADHGTDPTTRSYDHSREYVPMLYYPRPPGAPDACYQGYLSDTGASAFQHLTGEVPSLAGAAVQALRPGLGWRAYPAIRPRLGVGSTGVVACKVGPQEVAEAAAFLGSRLGPAPLVAIILGSGLDTVSESMAESAGAAFHEIPFWPRATVPGHAGRIAMGARRGVAIAVVHGRAHGYEGLDQSEEQLPVRALARWGVQHLIVTNASGSLDPRLVPGEVGFVTRVLDLQTDDPEEGPIPLEASDMRLAARMGHAPAVTYMAVPGPQYETGAEVEALLTLGGNVVGMSAAAEVRAARDEGLHLLVLTAVANAAGMVEQSGSDAHRQVMGMSAAASLRVLELVDAALGTWGLLRP